jgi:predicted Zn-dependent peptidase
VSEPDHRLITLDNGLRVVTVELPHLHTATVLLFLKVGSRFESPSDNGLSHFVEHMLFRGTERYPTSYEINFAVESLGGTLYAETGRDFSLFQVALDPTEVGQGLELFGELFGRPRFGDIELERKLILEEINEDYDDKGIELNGSDIARGALFGDHPLGQRIIGPRQNVERFTTEDVQRHFEQFYGAENALLAVAGPVTADSVEQEARRHLAVIPRGTEANATTPEVHSTAARFVHVEDTGAQCDINLLWPAVPELDPDYAASIALSRVVDDGMSTRLHYRLCDQLGLAYSINAGLEPLHDVVLFEVTGATASSKLTALVREVLQLLGELRETDVTVAELEKVKRRYRYDLAYSTDDANAMASWYGGTRLFYTPLSLADKAAAMDAVSTADIRRVAQRIFKSHALTLVAVGSLTKARQAEVRELVSKFG